MGAILVVMGVVIYSAVDRLTAEDSPAEIFGIADYRAAVTQEPRPAPSFIVPALGGGAIDSGDYAGEVLVVNFWASWCGPCRQEAPALQTLWEEYRARGVAFLGVNFKDDPAAAQAYEDEFGITFPSALDPSGKLAHEFGVLALPTTFVVSRGAVIKYQFTGIISADVLRDAIDDVLGKEAG